MDDKGENARTFPCTSSKANNLVNTRPNNVQRTSPPVPSYLLHPPPPPWNPQSNKLVNSSGHASNKCPNISSELKNLETEVEEQTPSSTSNNGTHPSSGTKNIRGQNNHVSSPVQINKITSSDDEKTPPPLPRRPPGGHGALNKRKSLGRELANLQNNACSIKSGNLIVMHCRFIL